MTLVDSGVWMDYFKGAITTQTKNLYSLLGSEPLAIGDLILIEVLQSFANERDFKRARKLLTSLMVIDLGGQATAIQAVRHFRRLRQMGITVLKTINVIIATCCIENDYELLHNHRDFDPFVKHLGLRSVI